MGERLRPFEVKKRREIHPGDYVVVSGVTVIHRCPHLPAHPLPELDRQESIAGRDVLYIHRRDRL